MVTHRNLAVVLLCILILPLAFIAACDKVPLLAPTGSVITLQIPDTTAISLNSEMPIVVTVIENGVVAGGSGPTVTRSTGGTPVQNGTLVSFTTTLGRIEPAEARTHNGQVTVRLITGGASGSAVITAFSGGASTTKTVSVGTAAVKTVTVTTTPQTLGASGGTVQVLATVTDTAGGFLSGVPVTFATDRGSVAPSTVATDANGVAVATLTTNGTAKVTATAGAVTSTASTVTVNARALASFAADPASASAGIPVKFTVTPAANTNISDVRVDFGDGTGVNLGPIGAAASTSHAYSAPGFYTATARSIDSTGDTGTLQTSVVIGTLQVTMTAADTTPTINTPTQFTVAGLGTAQVDHFVWTFDDGSPSVTTTSPVLTHTFVTLGPKAVRADVFGVNGGVVGTASIVVTVVPPAN
jgi:Bacterial Ig-like domain (group 1)/PKD domain